MKKTGHRISIFWEEFGTFNEGGMEDGRDIEVKRAPTKREMTKIEKGLEKILEEVGLLKPRRREVLIPQPAGWKPIVMRVTGYDPEKKRKK